MNTDPVQRIKEDLRILKKFIGKRVDEPYGELERRIDELLLVPNDLFDQDSIRPLLAYFSSLIQNKTTEKRLDGKLRIVLAAIQDQQQHLPSKKRMRVDPKNIAFTAASPDSPHTYFTPTPKEAERLRALEEDRAPASCATVPIAVRPPGQRPKHSKLSDQTPLDLSNLTPRGRLPSSSHNTPKTKRIRK